jgi:hypothetical protein
MFHKTLCISFFLTLPVLILSLQCYDCKGSIKLNYTVTSETIPLISSQCQLINASVCSIDVIWDLKTNTSIIEVDGFNGLTGREIVPNTLGVLLSMAIRSDNTTREQSHILYYDCNTIEKADDEINLKKILRSLVIEEQFQQEIGPLIQIVSPFDAKTANCLDFRHSVFDCPRQDFDTCSRCLILMNDTTSDQKVCATCPYESESENMVARWKTFFFSNQTQDSDTTYLTCQQKGCNSFDNINRIKKASKITFNFDEYFKN